MPHRQRYDLFGAARAAAFRWRPKIRLVLRYLDAALPRLSHLSQVGLLAVAIVVYVYTVIPIYQKETLTEEIAHKQLELTGVNAQLDQAKAERDEARRDAAKADVALEKAYLLSRRYASQVFIFEAGPPCSGLMVPLPPMPQLGQREPEGPDVVEQGLAIDIGECLRKATARVEASQLLKDPDLSMLREDLEAAIPALEAKRQQAMAEYKEFEEARKAEGQARQRKLDSEFQRTPDRVSQLEAERRFMIESLTREPRSRPASVKAYQQSIREAVIAVARKIAPQATK